MVIAINGKENTREFYLVARGTERTKLQLHNDAPRIWDHYVVRDLGIRVVIDETPVVLSGRTEII